MHNFTPLDWVRNNEQVGHGLNNVIEIEVRVLPFQTWVNTLPPVLYLEEVCKGDLAFYKATFVKLSPEIVDTDGAKDEEKDHEYDYDLTNFFNSNW